MYHDIIYDEYQLNVIHYAQSDKWNLELLDI